MHLQSGSQDRQTSLHRISQVVVVVVVVVVVDIIRFARFVVAVFFVEVVVVDGREVKLIIYYVCFFE